MEYLQKVSIVGVILVILGVGVSLSNGQQVCNITVQELLTCKAAATPPNPPPPTSECCSAISRADLVCLCKLKGLLPAYGVDVGLAMQLPQKCNVPNIPPCPTNTNA